MVKLPVAQFVAKNGQDLVVGAALLLLGRRGGRRRLFGRVFLFGVVLFVLFDVALDQRVEQHDALVVEEAVEVGVAVRRPLRSCTHRSDQCQLFSRISYCILQFVQSWYNLFQLNRFPST